MTVSKAALDGMESMVEATRKKPAGQTRNAKPASKLQESTQIQ
jgi:hypothetical protein